MPTLGFDTETHLIGPALLAPPMVCLSIANSEGSWLYHVDPKCMPRGPLGSGKPPASTAREAVEWMLGSQEAVGLNTAYDLAVIGNQWPELYPRIFDALDDDRVIDVGLCQQLIDNALGEMKLWKAQGGYSLAALEKRLLRRDRTAQKKAPNAWRLRYRELQGVELHLWPVEAVEYALEDAVGAHSIFKVQWQNSKKYLKDAPNQQRAALALQLMMCWGVRTDKEQVDALRSLTEEKYEELTITLSKESLIRQQKSGGRFRWVKDTKAAKRRMYEICNKEGLPIKLTDAGEKKLQEKTKGVNSKNLRPRLEELLTQEELIEYTSVDEDACRAVGDEALLEYVLRSQLHAVLHTHVPDLEKGVRLPIQPRYTTMVESGRTACSKGSNGPLNGFQFQNPKRSFVWIPPNQDKAVNLFPPGIGIRECFRARTGKLFADNDYSGLELHTGAQVCKTVVGVSNLGKALNAGIDPHLDFGASLMGISYKEAKERKHEKEVKHYRQLAKCANFGLPGGLGWRGLVGFSRGYGVKLSESEAKQLIENWFDKYPEWRMYFSWVRDQLTNKKAGKESAEEEIATGDFAQLFVHRIRGGCYYTEGCNTLFQGLGADVAKRALYEVQKRCYTKTTGPDSVLYGVRPVGFIHDEILAEVDESLAHEQAFQLAEVMVREGNVLLPDYPVRCTPALSRYWCKDAEAVFDCDGRLQPYDLARKGRWEVYYDRYRKERVKW